jgi:predicted phage terminase large subunit-like protein
MRGNTGVRWTNTFVSKRHYAWQAMLVDERGMARDPRFNFWNRFFVQALYHGPNGEAISAWPHMWPVDNEERIRLKVPNRRTLVEIREGLGEAVFQSEYQGRPGDVEGRKFPTFDESDAIDRWGYSIEGDEIRWGSTTRSLAEVLREGRLAITADTSDTHGPTSDYKAAACLLHLPTTNELFVLDLFCKRCPESELEAAIFTFAERWKVPLLCPEKEKGSKNLIASILNKLRTRASTLKGLSFVPALRPITPTGDKTKRIDSSLSYRFEHNKIRLPVHLRNKAPWNELFREIGAFNADAPNGGIDHDDALDVVAMGESVVGWKATPTGTDDVVESTIMDLIERNEQVEGLGNLSRIVDITTLPLERVLKFLGEQRPKDAVNLI